MLKNLKNDNSGVVFITVLAIIITMMVLAVSIISMNVSQTMVTEREVKRIKAEQMMIGGMAYFYANQLSDTPGDPVNLQPVNMDGIDYDVSIVLTSIVGPNGPGDSESDIVTINVDY